MTDLVITETGLEHAPCPCCTGTVFHAQGDVDLDETQSDDSFLAWYTARWVSTHADEPMRLRLHFGDWSDGAARADRRVVLVDYVDGRGFRIAPWPPGARDVPQFTPLDPADIAGTPLQNQVADSIDAILTRDTRVAGAFP